MKRRRRRNPATAHNSTDGARIACSVHLFAIALIASALVGCIRHSTSCQFSCPPGSRQMGAAPPKREETWCEKRINGKALKEGPFILYGPGGGKILQGTYRDGVQVGEWT